MKVVKTDCIVKGLFIAILSISPFNAHVDAAIVINAPLPVKVAVGAKQFPLFSNLAVEPDGRAVAYAVQDGTQIAESRGTIHSGYTRSGIPIGVQGCDIWLTNVRNGRTLDLTKGLGSSWNPVWSGNGRYLAFFSSYGGAVHVWMWDRLSGKRRRISTTIARDVTRNDPPVPQRMIQWMDGDRKLLVPLLPKDMSVADADTYTNGYLVMHNGRMQVSHGSIRVYSNDPKAPRNSTKLAYLQGYDAVNAGDPFDYALINVASGAVTRILPTTIASSAMMLSDDRRYAALVSGMTSGRSDQGLFDIKIISLADRKTLFSIRSASVAMSWQPQADAFVYTTGMQSGQSYLVSVPDGRSRKITSGKHPDFNSADPPAAWGPDGSSLYYVIQNRIWVTNVGMGIIKPLSVQLPMHIRAFIAVSDSRLLQRDNMIYVLTSDLQTKQEGIVAINRASGALSHQFLGNRRIGGIRDTLVSASPTSIIYEAQDTRHPWDLWSIGTSLTHPHQLTHLNPKLEHYRYGQARLIIWTTPDGQSYRGALILPSDYIPGHRYPTIISQYPNENMSDYLNVFGGDEVGTIWGNYQLYATRGYAVFMPDMHWKHFADADITNGRALRWLNAMLDKLIAIGISDTNRFGIEGLSAGGWSTLAFITQTNRLQAAIDDSGFASQLSLYTEFSQNVRANRDRGVPRLLAMPRQCRRVRRMHLDYGPRQLR